MGWIDALRKAEQQGRGVAHRGFDKARDKWEDAERRLRRKMRIFPDKAKQRAAPARTPAELETRHNEPAAEPASSNVGPKDRVA